MGAAVKKSGIPREELFITTKLWVQDTSYEGAKMAAKASMERLGLEYLDLYLIHQPFGDYYGAWRAMEEMYRDGIIRAIGVCNFDEACLVDLCINHEILPAVNQIEIHPFHQQTSAIQTMNRYKVQPRSYCGGISSRESLLFQSQPEKNEWKKIWISGISLWTVRIWMPSKLWTSDIVRSSTTIPQVLQKYLITQKSTEILYLASLWIYLYKGSRYFSSTQEHFFPIASFKASSQGSHCSAGFLDTTFISMEQRNLSFAVMISSFQAPRP